MASNKEKDFRNAYILVVIFLLGVTLGWNLIYVFLRDMGFGTGEMLVFAASNYAVFLVLSLVVKRLSANRSIKFSFAVRAVSFLILIAVFSHLQIYVAGILTGFITMFYWLPFNVKTYTATAKNESAFKAGMVSIVTPMLTAIITIAGAGLVASYGYSMLFISGAFIFGLAYFFVDRSGPTFEMKLDIKKGMASMGRMKSLFFVQGFWEGMFWFMIPIITLSYTQSVTMFGAFLTYVALFSIAATLFVTRLSDKKRNRKAFIVPIFLLTALFVVVSYFTTDLLTWTLVNSGIAFFAAMMAPFMGAVLRDKIKDVHNGIFGREILLNAGRFAGCAAIGILILLGQFRVSLILAALTICVYVFLILRKKIY
jgi:predicted MFS family arabinose efflux permease